MAITMRRAIRGALLAAAACACAVPGAQGGQTSGRSMDFVSVWGARGPSSLVGYVSSSWYSATAGTRAGQSLWTYDVASLKGSAVTGGGVQFGAQRGLVAGTIDVSHWSMVTRPQAVYVEAAGSVFDPVDGYADLVSGDAGFPARYFEMSATALFINGSVAFDEGVVEPYLGAGLGVSVMTVSSRAVPGVDGRNLGETRVGIAFQLAAGVRVIPWDAAFLWLEFRPGWHVMGPFEKGAGYERSRDQFILQVLPVILGIGWMWS
jgi:hypothetical protein